MKKIYLITAIMAILVPQLRSQGVYLQPGANVSVVDGGKLIVAGGANGQMTIHTNSSGSGSVVVDDNPESAVSLAGNANIECYLATEAWHLIGSPIQNALSGIFFDDYLITSDPTSSTGWGPYIVPVNIPLEVFRGYAVWKPLTNPSFETFSGTLNNGTVSIDISRNAADPWAGWHLIGNPYPCAIDLDSPGIVWNQVEPTAYFWNPASGNYYTYPHLSSPPPIVGGDHDQYVPSMQAFYVHISDTYSGTTTMQIDNSARLHNPEPFLKSAAQTDGILVLKAEGEANSFYDKAVIHFNPIATAGYDAGYDAYKLAGDTKAPQLYAETNGTRLSYDALPYAGVTTLVHMGFSSGIDGQYTITALNTDAFPGLSHIYLEDLKESTIQDLLIDQEYTFTYAKSDPANRFNIRFENPSIGIEGQETAPACRIWASGDGIYVQQDAAVKGPSVLRVVDLLGRERFRATLSGRSVDMFRPGLTPGCYVATVTSDTEVQSQKVILQ